MDECGLWWKFPPTRTIKKKSRQTAGLKLQKSRSTILLGGNASLEEFQFRTQSLLEIAKTKIENLTEKEKNEPFVAKIDQFPQFSNFKLVFL